MALPKELENNITYNVQLKYNVQIFGAVKSKYSLDSN